MNRPRRCSLGARLRAASIATVLGAHSLGCVSTQAGPQLDRTYQLVSSRLREPTRQSSVTPQLGLDAALDRDTVIALAVSRSSSLSALAHRARSMVHAARAEGSLPPGELGVQAWNLPLTRPYAVGDADMYMVELRQRFPAGGSLDARARAISEDAQVTLAEVAIEERLTAQRAADAYASYVRGRLIHSLQHDHLALLEQMQRAAQARFATGGSGIADSARIDLELAKTSRALARLDGDIAQASAAINALLRRAFDAPLGMPRDLAPQTIHLPVDALITRARSGRGSALAAEARVRAARARVDAAEAEANMPEVSVGLGYWQEPAQRPGIGVSAAMSLPWLWGPARYRLDEAKELEASERSSVEGVSLELQSEVTVARAQLAALEQELVVVHNQTVPAAHRSIDAVRAAYTTGNASLLEWVDAARSLLDLEIEETELSAELAHAVAALERAVGSQLPRVTVLSEEHP